MTTQRDVDREAKRLAELLRQSGRRIVFAESCTGGLISAALTAIPGISEYHCGSAVVYQVQTKHRWLGIAESLLQKPGPVSREVALAMARAVLDRTPQADLAASVTGHLGPNAPKRQDGLVYSAVAVRSTELQTFCRRERLAGGPDSSDGRRLRLQRRKAAAAYVLRLCSDVLESATDRV